MKRASVYLHDYKAGTLTEDENGYTFLYDKDFLESAHAEAISLTMPLTDKPYQDKVLFPFFDGLIPEGWLLNIAETSWKIKRRRPRFPSGLLSKNIWYESTSYPPIRQESISRLSGTGDPKPNHINRSTGKVIFRHSQRRKERTGTFYNRRSLGTIHTETTN